MKKLTLALLLVLLGNLIFAGLTQTETQLKELLDKKEFFRMRKILRRNPPDISEVKKLYFNAFVENAYNKNQYSINTIESLFSNYSDALDDTMKADLLKIQQDNFYKTYEYEKAGKTGEIILTMYKSVMDSMEIADIENSNIIYNALTKVEKQSVSFKNEVKIPLKRDLAKLMNVPVKFADSLYDFIFDTGANISTINTTLAKKLGLKIFDVTFDVGSSTGVQNKSAIGVADSFYMGNILIRNAVFLVVPDEMISFPSIGYYVNGIIGYPVIEQLKEVRINKNGYITIPAQTVESELNNLALDGLMPIVSFITDKDTLCFHFDTGAKHTDLFKPYLDKYKNEVIEKGKPEVVQMGGAGGMVETEVYTLPEFNIYIGNKKVVLTDVKVLTKNIDEAGDKFYGNIGQDLISKFDEMILNFEDMYIDFK
ncbi:MAG: hypothetical protein C4539_13640 [Ignavibacteriales bacterium]|nr:MAG: hypothetical protein C4539_13640 [Ignavibacteriales bacterium]